MSINDVKLLINEINETKISNNSNINYQKINNLFKITEKKLTNKIIHINNYEKKLIFINTKFNCIKCNKNAIYQNQLIEKELYCWAHAHNII